MVVDREHIANIICLYDSGERFMVRNVSEQQVFALQEDGKEYRAGRAVNGGVELDEGRIASFCRNLALSQALSAAEKAASRRFSGGHYDVHEQQEASRVLDITREQRSAFQTRFQSERGTVKAGTALARQFLSDLTQMGPGANAIFFGASVKHCGDDSGPFFRVNGGQARGQAETLSVLSDLTATIPSRSVSLDSLIHSARDQVAQQTAQNQSKAQTREPNSPDGYSR